MTGKFFAYLMILCCFSSCKKEIQKVIENTSVISDTPIKDIKPSINLIKTKEKAIEAFAFTKEKKLNTDFCILIDMSLHSGVNRFLVWDFKEKKITHQYLVGHGCGTNSWSSDDSKENPTFSNEDGSHLSALGKYKLQGRGRSDWGVGVKYLMHRFDETNNNALKRFIVFHS